MFGKSLALKGVALIPLVLAACGSVAGNTNGAGASASASVAPSAGATVSVGSSRLGQILVDGSGKTLYLFEADKGTQSTCFGPCAQFWPPLTTLGTVKAGGNATQS